MQTWLALRGKRSIHGLHKGEKELKETLKSKIGVYRQGGLE